MKKAQVHCTVIGFGVGDSSAGVLYSGEGEPKAVRRISPYLREEETVIVSSRNTPVCNVPKAGIGNKPIDGGFFYFPLKKRVSLLPANRCLKSSLLSGVGRMNS